jgi:membrane protease YdiL (CAAX protease family)
MGIFRSCGLVGRQAVSDSTRMLRRRAPATASAAPQGDRRARIELMALLALLLVTLAASFAKGQDIYVFAYIMTIVVAIGGPRRHGRSWADIGLKTGFGTDLRRVWYLAGLDAIVFQLVPPTLLVAIVLGYGGELASHISARLPVDIGSAAGLVAIGGLLGLALVLTLAEEIVFRVIIQDRLAWFVGTPAAILLAAILFGVTHAVGTGGSLHVVLTDVAGVTLDGIFFGLIYARTHNLLVTWATHYAADVVGVIALLTIFRAT